MEVYGDDPSGNDDLYYQPASGNHLVKKATELHQSSSHPLGIDKKSNV